MTQDSKGISFYRQQWLIMQTGTFAFSCESYIVWLNRRIMYIHQVINWELTVEYKNGENLAKVIMPERRRMQYTY
jgi:hypothetical protein